MTTFAIIKSGGKQYLVTGNQDILVDRINTEDKNIKLETLMTFDGEKGAVNLKVEPIQAEIVEHLKGDKIRVAKFKSKVRYRRVNGFRAALTKLRIGAL